MFMCSLYYSYSCCANVVEHAVKIGNIPYNLQYPHSHCYCGAMQVFQQIINDAI